MAKVNLDALIPRADFFIEQNNSGSLSLGDKVKANELIKNESFFYSSLKKPDFQRETADWDKEKIVSFVKSFIDGDLIPSIILWQAGEHIFVIDGAHRLSALIAWVNDDYGDGFISQPFFNHDIDIEQKKSAEQTRRYINQIIGSYKDLVNSVRNPEMANTDRLKTANKLGYLSIQIQWVTGGAEKAESSFFTINQKATPITETEIFILKSRKKPHALASRAILRSGLGHNYWKNFTVDNQERIQFLAKEINEAMFTPELQTPIKTLDLPLAGKGYSSNSLSLILDFVRLANNAFNQEINDDHDGTDTIRFLQHTLKIVRRLTTTHPSSLGLHPILYFYSEKGRYQPTAFMAWVEIFKELEMNNQFNEFTKRRENFERILLYFKNLTSQVTYRYGSGLKGYKYLVDVYKELFSLSETPNVTYIDIKKHLKQKYPYLTIENTEYNSTTKDFDKHTKSEVFIEQVLPTCKKCSICNGYIHSNSITIDHIQRKEDGGLGVLSNGQLAHPYCNSTYKN